MALPQLNLLDLTGPKNSPANVVLLQVQQAHGGGRRRLGRVPMTFNVELGRNLFVFDERTSSEPFENPEQFRIVLADDDGRDLGETIIDSSDGNSDRDRLTIDIFVNGIIGGPNYELGYTVSKG
ncbi:hypothetical protein A5792_26705 [Mycolicibacterium peregrinum]|uniref:Uncharacterized protein n=1 Tax=Mycolicibacterium peregrinum TaxID=43304 RepID=A0A1A0QWY2_MYCPR|nr:hypothetical protein [Mycolicibacterium peregrinum]OBB26617.1 hypothetical protein A5792_26705 [Mycolicibacterium peregrinum]